MDGEQDLENMQIVKFRWLVWNQVSLKEASKYQAVLGIVLSIITLVFYAVSDSLPESGLPELHRTVARAFVFNLIYSILLLKRVRGNRANEVIRTIKEGCLIWNYILLLDMIPSFDSLIPVITLMIYAILSVKPKIVSIYIYTDIITFVISGLFTGYYIVN